MTVSSHSQCLEILTFRIIFAKPGHIANTLLILALPFFRSLWQFPVSVVQFPPNWWWRLCTSPDLVRTCPPIQPINALKASCMTCVLHGIWFLIGGHRIQEASRVDCSFQEIKELEEALPIIILRTWPSVSPNWSSTSIIYMASLAPICWTLI
jgi:hypothetical protein